MKTIRLGGVPEHFNHPVHQAIEKGLFHQAGIDLQWQTFDGGTGDMVKALDNETSDVCILLTEGIISAILHGSASRIISGYVNSPLIWGVHTGNSRNITYEQAFEHTIAISRFGSGSHLMPIVDALMKGRNLDAGQFEVVGNLSGAISSLEKEDTDIFYWEKYTTMPSVEKGLLKRIGEFLSPWPCFLMAASDKAISLFAGELDTMLRIIHRACDDFMNDPSSPEVISEVYGIDPRHARYWFHATEWATNSWVSNKILRSVSFTLREAGIIDPALPDRPLVWDRKEHP